MQYFPVPILFSPWVKTKRNFVTIQMKANEQYTCISRDTQLFFGSRLWVCMYRMESLKFERNSSVSSDILHGSKFPNSYWFKVVRNIWKSYMWTEEWRIIWRKIIAVIYATFNLRFRKESQKKFKLVRDSFSCHLKLKRAHGFSDPPAKFQKKGIGIVKRVCCITCQEIMTGNNEEQVV